VHLGGADLSRHRGHHGARITAEHQQPAAGRRGQRLQAGMQEVDPRPSGPGQQHRIQHEQAQHLTAAGGRGQQGRVVVQPEVTAEPQNGGSVGHAGWVPGGTDAEPSAAVGQRASIPT
jgi:hypothetical protein